MTFDKQFVEPIQKGIKLHTIRQDVTNRWKKGVSIHFKHWTGRPYHSPMADIIPVKPVVSKQRVFMSITQGRVCISIDSKELFGYPERNEFAINEGFENWEAFENYFYPIVEDMEDEVCTAKLIHWTDKRYESLDYDSE